MKFSHQLMLGIACLSLGTGVITYQTSSPKLQADSVTTKNFKQVKLGMNKRQVLDTLGKPQDKYEADVWTYPVKDKQPLTLVFKKDTLENVSDHTLISSKNSVTKKVSAKTKRQNINAAFKAYLKQAHEYAKAGQTEFAYSSMIQKVTFDGDDELKVTVDQGFDATPTAEKDEIAQKLAELSKSFLHRYNKKAFDLEFYENKHEIGSNHNDSLTQFEWEKTKWAKTCWISL